MKKSSFQIIYDISSKFKSMNIQQVIQANPHILTSDLKTNYGEMYFINIFVDIENLFQYAKKEITDKKILEKIEFNYIQEKEIRDRIKKITDKYDSKSLPLESDIFDLLKDDVSDRKIFNLLKHENLVASAWFGIWLYVDDLPLNDKNKITSFIMKMCEWNTYGGGDLKTYFGIDRPDSDFIRGDLKIRFLEWTNEWTVNDLEKRMDEFIDDLKPFLVDDPRKWKKSPEYAITECCQCGDGSDWLHLGLICENCYEKMMKTIEDSLRARKTIEDSLD